MTPDREFEIRCELRGEIATVRPQHYIDPNQFDDDMVFAEGSMN